jgi:hypothetical protein
MPEAWAGRTRAPGDRVKPGRSCEHRPHRPASPADPGDPYAIVARLRDTVPSGSYLAISHAGSDRVDPEAQQGIGDSWSGRVQQQFTLRSRAQAARFFAGTDLVEPGVSGQESSSLGMVDQSRLH